MKIKVMPIDTISSFEDVNVRDLIASGVWTLYRKESEPDFFILKTGSYFHNKRENYYLVDQKGKSVQDIADIQSILDFDQYEQIVILNFPDTGGRLWKDS